jgi:hypothetical protein
MTAHAGEILCTQIVPKIRSAIPASIRKVGAEDHAEIIADTIAHAAALLHSAEAAHKKIAPGTEIESALCGFFLRVMWPNPAFMKPTDSALLSINA